MCDAQNVSKDYKQMKDYIVESGCGAFVASSEPLTVFEWYLFFVCVLLYDFMNAINLTSVCFLGFSQSLFKGIKLD